MTTSAKRSFGAFIKTTFASWWKTACGEELEYPKGVNAPSLTCLGCLAYDGPVKQIRWVKHSKDGTVMNSEDNK